MTTADPSTLEGFSHVGIQVADIERSVRFYGDTLGLELVTRWVRDQEYIRELVGYPGVELHVAVFRLPASDAYLEVLEYKNVQRAPVDPATANPGTGHFCLYVNDIDALVDRLRSHGVQFVSRIMSPDTGPNRGGKAVYMMDPDGIRVELLETTKALDGSTRPGKTEAANV